MTAEVAQAGPTIAAHREVEAARERPGRLEDRPGGADWSPPMTLERSCRSKQVYLTKAEAKQVVRLMGARHRDAFHLYPCTGCGYWHVAHVVPTALRARVVPAWERAAVRLGVVA